MLMLCQIKENITLCYIKIGNKDLVKLSVFVHMRFLKNIFCCKYEIDTLR